MKSLENLVLVSTTVWIGFEAVITEKTLKEE